MYYLGKFQTGAPCYVSRTEGLTRYPDRGTEEVFPVRERGTLSSVRERVSLSPVRERLKLSTIQKRLALSLGRERLTSLPGVVLSHGRERVVVFAGRREIPELAVGGTCSVPRRERVVLSPDGSGLLRLRAVRERLKLSPVRERQSKSFPYGKE